jgi:hypothetical protein
MQRLRLAKGTPHCPRFEFIVARCLPQGEIRAFDILERKEGEMCE